MELTPAALGTAAQILALLVLAAAFTPDYRGTLAKKWIRDTDGNRYHVPTVPPVVRFANVYRIIVTGVAIAAIAIDFYFMLTDAVLTGAGRSAVIVLNLGAGGCMLIYIFTSAIEHASSARTDPQPEDSRDQ